MTRALLGVAAALLTLSTSLPSASAQSTSVEIAFIANSSDATVALWDVATRSIVGRIDVNPARVKASGPGAPNDAQDTDLSPDGKTLYVSRAYMGDVAAFDMVTGALLWNTSLNTWRADHMTITHDGRSLFVSAMFDNRVYRIATATGVISGHFISGVYPHDNKVSRPAYGCTTPASAPSRRSHARPPRPRSPRHLARNSS